ncbi:MAG: xanthine phosphoribosyltransferase [Brevinema sp.]
MISLKEMVLLHASVPADGIIKVDRFLNHIIEPTLILQIGQDIGARFQEFKIDKILTIEASGIAPALGVGLALNVPVLFAKKSQPSTMIDGYTVDVHSFTKQKDYKIFVSKEYLRPDEHVLIVDDFLAMGNSILGMKDIIKQAGAHCIGAGIVIEKSFQAGRSILEKEGLKVESLIRIQSISAQDGIQFLE